MTDSDAVQQPVSQSILELQRRLQQASMTSLARNAHEHHSSAELPSNHSKSATAKGIDLHSQDNFPSLPISSTTSTSNRPVWKPPTMTPSSNHITEHFEIPPQMQLKQQLGKQSSSFEICKGIMRRIGTSIELSTNQKSGTLTVLISGNPKAVNQARREVLHGLCAQITQQISVPASVRSFIVGKGGQTLKGITSRTLTEINIIRTDKPRDGNTLDIDPSTIDPFAEQTITIIGDPEGVAMAQKEIEMIVAARTSTHISRVKVDRSYHQFIAGPGGCAIAALQDEHGIKIHIAPADAVSSNTDINDIVLVGDRSAVLPVLAKITQQYEDLKRSTRSISVPIKKQQHRFIFGHKGSALQEIFTSTNCIVEIPPASSDSDVVFVRGPENMLTIALQLVLEKTNSIFMDEIPVATFLPATLNANFMIQFLIKDRIQFKAIETEHSVIIASSLAANGKPATIDVLAKSKESMLAGRNAVVALLKEKGHAIYLNSFDISSELHGYVIGKGGQNIIKLIAKPQWNGRLVNVIMPNEDSKSDQVILAIKRDATIPALAASNTEALALFELIKNDIIDTATANADVVVKTLLIDPRFHGRLIGFGGATFRDIVSPYNGSVSIKFPALHDKTDAASTASKSSKPNGSKDSASNSSEVVIKGPQKNVEEVCHTIEKLVADMRHLETISSFREKMTVPKTHVSLLMSFGLGRTVRAIRERFANQSLKLLPAEKIFEKDLATPTSMLHLSTEITTTTGGNDTLTITGPKTFVLAAKEILSDRLEKLANFAEVHFNVFDEMSAEARQVLQDMGAEFKQSAFRRLVGKDAKHLKKFSEQYDVYIKTLKTRTDETDEESAGAENSQSLGTLKIEGNKTTVKDAKRDIIAFVQNDVLHSFRLTFHFPRSALPHVVGRGGSRLTKLKEDLEARVDLNDDYESDQVKCTIWGRKSECLELKRRIEDAIDKLVNIDTVNVSIPSFLHRHIIGPAGSTIRKLIDEAGGPDQVKINFPKNGDGSDENVVVVTAHSSSVHQAVSQLMQLVAQVVAHGGNGTDQVKAATSIFSTVYTVEDAHKVQKVTFPKADMSYAFGRLRDGLIDLMRKHGVTIWIEEDEATASIHAHIAGGEQSEKHVQQCAAAILSHLPVSKTVALPVEILEILQVAGTEQVQMRESINEHLRRIRSDHGVTIEFPNSPAKSTEGSFISIRGSNQKMDAAISALDSAFKNLKSNKHLICMTIAAGYRPHIIGRGGQTLKRICDETGALLDFVSQRHHNRDDHANSNAVEILKIRGVTQTSVDAAKAIVDGLIAEQSVRIKRDAERQQAREAAARQQPARIDDDSSTTTYRTGGIPGYVPPGFSGRSSASQSNGVGASTSIKVASAISGFEFSANQHQMHQPTGLFTSGSAVQDQGWKSVSKKNNRASSNTSGNTTTLEEAAPVAPVAPIAPVDEAAPTTGKKKNKKKKSKPVSDADAQVERDIVSPEPEVVVASSDSTATAQRKDQSKQVQKPVHDAIKPAAASAPVACVVDMPKRAPSPIAFEVAEDDGWQTVSTKRTGKVATNVESTAADTSIPTESATKKKSKKNGIFFNVIQDEQDDENNK
ncbi:hypothetical protein BATDEDRAFT_36186 [Batrachochytrium dendrobatidis JAM81]|uniref:K Homology domain-containing protein n=2 Tax=Batrachochytrium dendrobatidis TaxID=109871 RepID=F4PD87_BATDJ|nr:uncharacterized protein BATDEDRAFT_36186 [Batrachochytrium dendrobatidis JAM81]EGF76748.1 hypothetical protein BATDEDRAFT_36186 [Batrachochytrium dendrobatidis JAM81]OAJ45331.1 hypothetical protein BDEG_28478 [Batrachochytrium dendrobatidis JEL423]|eukprot:XP_006682651.1 hypothetical protein BATDEDRAFT_36186 [Batrachochytrium dendrobatidis JAM81]